MRDSSTNEFTGFNEALETGRNGPTINLVADGGPARGGRITLVPVCQPGIWDFDQEHKTLFLEQCERRAVGNTKHINNNLVHSLLDCSFTVIFSSDDFT